MLETTDFTMFNHNKENPTLIDELSSTEYYIGISNNFSDRSKPSWRIKRIWKVGSIWFTGFPNGNQDFIYVWDNRLDYTYKI